MIRELVPVLVLMVVVMTDVVAHRDLAEVSPEEDGAVA